MRVFTDGGVVGIGECSPMQAEIVAHFVTTAFKPRVLDENPLEIEKIWNSLFYGTYKLGPQGVQTEALAGIDIALWDILGKVTGLPLNTLLGGSYRDKIKMYKSIGGGSTMSTAEMLGKVENALEEGFEAIKIRMDWGANQKDINPEKDLRMFQETKKLVGEEVPLSFDANNGYSVKTAISQGREFQKVGIYHFEEPVPQYDYRGLARVTQELEAPISAGEHEYTRWQFRDLITEGGVDIIQPDVVKCGGITETRKIASLGSTFDRLFVPHQTQPTVGTIANLHICSSLQSCRRPQEYTGPHERLENLFEEKFIFEDGYLHLPQKPGLGLTVDEEKLEELTVSSY